MELLTEDEDQVIVRTKRSAEVCKYKKGDWAECDQLTMVNLIQFCPPGWSRNVLITDLLQPVPASPGPQTANNKSF